MKQWCQDGAIELLRVSVGQRAAKLQSVKIRWFDCPGLKPRHHAYCWTKASSIFFSTLNLTSYHFEALYPTETHSATLERSWYCCWYRFCSIFCILKMDVALSKWIHIHNAYDVGVCIFLHLWLQLVWGKKFDNTQPSSRNLAQCL